ncbi:type II toxin-antitoxin system RelE/ParE family toxin [Enterovirga rhinocerotis]|uniref:Addiction module RelE/StbE family toxin n=1 Tax=Enterovirga rhinocerotis TaxID=1339210 RepID=A0A4V3DXS6_9HYPH|nr:type II toxin-antitoxin system RelE/ParE family toxin [Enterovirga rhinocerotis]TDR89619.1 addiction module RelE/StbE family toxin [Enterovirga rhinocerotis]
MRIRATSSAERDLVGIRRYISVDNPRAAQRVVGRIRSSAMRLVDQPEIGRPGERDGTREWVVSGLPYIIVYRVDWTRAEIVLLNVFHGAQDR